MIFPHCITGLSASNRQINGHSRGLRTFSKGYGCSSTSLTNAITLRFRSCSWTCDQRDLWWIITAFMMMSLDSLLLASWWSTVFEEHSFLSQNNVALCLANRHSLVHPFLDVSLWVAGRLHISSSGSITSHHFPSHVFCTTNWSYRSRTKPWIHNFILHNPSFDIVGLKHPIWMVAVLGSYISRKAIHQLQGRRWIELKRVTSCHIQTKNHFFFDWSSICSKNTQVAEWAGVCICPDQTGCQPEGLASLPYW